jgi:ketol-acid reductoisomerase
MKNYFNQLPFREQVMQLGMCRFMADAEFSQGVTALLNKKIVIVGCGAQGLNQGLNLRDSGLNVSYALRANAISEKRPSYLNASNNGFTVGRYEELLPSADLVINLTPDKQHTSVVNALMPLMKKGAVLSYSHGFNIVEEGMQIREDITVIMVAPKSPGTEVREEYKRGFGVPTLLAVHPANDPENKGLEWAKAYAFATGAHKAGVLHSSFVAEVKSDLMGEQTILCGVLQSGSILSFNKMVEKGLEPAYASRIVQYGWEVITEALKHGGITHMMDRLSNSAKIKAYQLAEELKNLMRPLFIHHMNAIMSGDFSREMMEDWANDDAKLHHWRELTGATLFEKTASSNENLSEQTYFDNAVLMVAFTKSGVELAYEIMTETGIKEESAYYESLHEAPLIANTIARKKLFEMNRIISDTAEYGCYLFDHACQPLLSDFMSKLDTSVIGLPYPNDTIDHQELLKINTLIRNHPIEKVGSELRNAMSNMSKKG